MLLMSLVTHVYAYINVPTFLKRNATAGALRLVAIMVILGFIWFIFQSRNVANFSTGAGSLAVLPVSCLAKQNGSRAYDTFYLLSTNATVKAFSLDQLQNDGI